MNCFIGNNRQIVDRLRKSGVDRLFAEFLDEFVVFLNENFENEEKTRASIAEFCDFFCSVRDFAFLCRPESIRHEFFVLLSAEFELLFDEMRFVSLGPKDESHLDSISFFIAQFCFERDQRNEHETSAQFFFNDRFTETFRLFVEEKLVGKSSSSFDINFRLVDRLVSLWSKLKQFNSCFMVESIARLIESQRFDALLLNADLQRFQLNSEENLFLYVLPKFVRSIDSSRSPILKENFSRKIVQLGHDFFEQRLEKILRGSSKENSSL